MPWLLLLAIALTIVFIRWFIRRADEIYTLALCSVGLFSFVWGFAIAPGWVQLVFELLAVVTLGWLRVRWRRS